MKLVLVFRIVVEADDAALPTDPIDHLAGRQKLVLARGPLSDRDFDVLITAVGDRGCGSSRGHKKSCDRANRMSWKFDTAASTITAKSHLLLFLLSCLFGRSFLGGFLCSFSHCGSSFRFDR